MRVVNESLPEQCESNSKGLIGAYRQDRGTMQNMLGEQKRKENSCI